ncbi:hypothetical protein GCM10010277_70130 [Streptomyces longisporoflavus]|nr:hypothetical protein GCM10010277_70130 [Streptomyces longisporoflavus]
MGAHLKWDGAGVDCGPEALVEYPSESAFGQRTVVVHGDSVEDSARGGGRSVRRAGGRLGERRRARRSGWQQF